MAMTVWNASELARAGRKNAPLRKALDLWLTAAEAATWRNLQDVRETFASADGVPIRLADGVRTVATVFNIKRNDYRLITVINYSAGRVVIREVLTHAEYSKGHWKDRL
jgi:mRNA interferase HigB